MFIPADGRSSVDILLRNMMSSRYITAVGSSAKSLLSGRRGKVKGVKGNGTKLVITVKHDREQNYDLTVVC